MCLKVLKILVKMRFSPRDKILIFVILIDQTRLLPSVARMDLLAPGIGPNARRDLQSRLKFYA